MSYSKQLIALFVLSCIVFAGAVWLGASRWEMTPAELHTGPAVPSNIRFVEAQTSAGINFVHFDSRRDSLLPEDVGSGAGWADYDNDGDDDLYLVNVAGPFLMESDQVARRPGNRLFRNDSGVFHDVTAEAGLGHAGWDYACCWFDYDNDGWLDVAVTQYGGVLLFRNQGNGHFAQTTATAGLAGIDRFLLGMTASDIDQDGDLDIYLCGYVKFDREAARHRPLVAGRPAVWTNPTSYAAEPNLLMVNQGDGTFVDATDSAGVANPDGKSMQALFCDFDNDGWQDLYVANDVGTADALFLNQRDGTFRDVSLQSGTHDRRASMGLAVGDVWHRGWLDLFATHWVAEDHALWKNRTADFRQNIPIAFDDLAPMAGLVRPKLPAYVGWGTGLVDLDNDGNLDLMLVNGSTIEDELTIDVLNEPKLIPQPAQLFRNSGNGDFVEVSSSAGEFFTKRKISHGLAFADYDLDGRLDAVVVSSGEPAALLHNETAPAGNWLQITLRGSASNRFGVGARVSLKAGEVIQIREQVLGTSYLSTNSYRLHFGVGAAEAIDWVEVHWPSGNTNRLDNPKVNQVVIIEE